MITRTNRFHGHGSLKHLYANGKTVRAAGLSLRYNTNPKRDKYRAAVVVSKKVSKSAVTRNRIRRRIYENVRILFGSINTPHDLLITVYDEKIADMPAAKLSQEIQKLLKKAHVTSAAPSERGIMEPKE